MYIVSSALEIVQAWLMGINSSSNLYQPRFYILDKDLKNQIKSFLQMHGLHEDKDSFMNSLSQAELIIILPHWIITMLTQSWQS